MKYKLINQPNKNFSAIQQILFNRGIKEQDILHYLNLSDQDINTPFSLGEDNLYRGLILIANAIKNNNKVLVIVDCDCDGFTAAALLIDYLHELFPSWAENKIDWFLHEGKQHGLNDCYKYAIENQYLLVICPDSASNDYTYHAELAKVGISVLVLDHHLASKVSQDAVIINNQLSDYPNKELSGVGITWQFCRYIDSVLKQDYANNFLDLVALGNCGDMMSLRSTETRYLISKGFKLENIKNPFISYMIDKNSFPLSKADYTSSNPEMGCTSMGAAFFIVPFVNAITRSGTMEEKQLLFKSMLPYKAFEKVLSTKRGHKLGEEEQLIIQAIRTVTNVKNRQTKAETAGMQLLESKLTANPSILEDHKILLFLLAQGEIESQIRGLIANKMMAKYQKPCCLLTYTDRDGTDAFEGSMRGYTKTGIEDFKAVLEQCPGVDYVEGHANAAGLRLRADSIDNFLSTIDNLLKDIPNDPIYKVDYDFKEIDNNNQIILDIANMNDFWGQDIDRAYININFKITNSNFQIMKSNTLKFSLPNNLTIIKFDGTEDQINQFTTTGYLELNAICKCNANKWNNQVYPQLIMVDYEIIDSSKYFF